jgi:hypothetical protein
MMRTGSLLQWFQLVAGFVWKSQNFVEAGLGAVAGGRLGFHRQLAYQKDEVGLRHCEAARCWKELKKLLEVA